MIKSIQYRFLKSKVPTYYTPPFDQNHPGLQYASQSTLAASSFPTTMTLVQDGSIAGGVPTQTFGWVFRPGDITAGHTPLFRVSGVTWPYSAGLQTYWPDGSLKWAAFSLMVPSGVKPSQGSSIKVTISDGGAGSWPAASGRSLVRDVYRQGLQINAVTPATPITGNGRSATLYAAFNGDSNQYRAIKYIDGAAGTCWKLSVKMATTIGGSPDPQFVADAYIFAMNNPSGGLGGFRWHGSIRQPFYKSGAKSYVMFERPNTTTPSAGLNWSVNPNGSGAVYTPPVFPFNAINFANGASLTGFIDNGSGNGSPSGIAGNVLTVTAVNFGFLGAGCFTTASYNGSFGHNDFTVSKPSTLTTPIVGGPLTYIISPDGTASTINVQVGNIYYLNPPAPPSYTNRTVMVFNPFSFTNNAAIPPGLYDGAALTGQYKILYQMTASNGDNPGLRGRYRLSGSPPNPISSKTMSYWAQRSALSTLQNNYWSGGEAGNIVPGVITGAHLPPISNPTATVTGGNNSIMFFAGSYGPTISTNNTNYIFGDINYTGPGGGTFMPMAGVAPFARFTFLDTNGRYNFFQGTGPIAADTTLRVEINQSYWHSTATFLPLDMTIGGLLPAIENLYGAYPWDWNPYNVGIVRTGGIDDGGPPIEVGLMNTDCGWDFYKQTALSEKAVRALGMSLAVTQCDFKDNGDGSFDQPLVLNGPGVSYTGLPASVGGVIQIPGSGGAPAGIGGVSVGDPSHEPDLGYWQFLRFGELQYFDYVVDWANLVSSQIQWGALPVPPFPYLTYGNVITQGQDREIGWANRDIQKIAFLCSYNPDPIAHPTLTTFDYGGVQLAQYLLDHADDQPRMGMAMMTSRNPVIYTSQAGADWVADRGCWFPNYNRIPGSVTANQEWEMAFLYGGMLFAVLRGNTDARDFVAARVNFWDYIGNRSAIHKGNSANGYIHFGPALAQNNQIQSIGGTEFGGGGGICMTQDGQFCARNTQPPFLNSPGITWAPNTRDGVTVTGNAFTCSGAGEPGWGGSAPNPGYVFSNGDILAAYAQGSGPGLLVPAALQQNGVYFVRDLNPTGQVSGTWTFNLAATRGGPAIPITDSSTGYTLNVRDHLIPANPSIEDSGGPTYFCHLANTLNWIHAIGSSRYGHNAFARFT